ncbi:YcjF family protein [Tundrisphaera lichenicola]|uniref:YcjF family protein n=1 Tax=Tundrisphaera lichenicola TaxID=2029860 RepID=UPI003EBDC59A
MTRTQRLWLALIGLTLSLGTAAWLVTSVGDMHDRLARTSPQLAIGFVAITCLAASATAIGAARLLWKLGRDERPPAQAPEDIVAAADVQAREAEAVVSQVKDPTAQARLRSEIATLRTDREVRRFHVVIFGTGSAGKTSLINALLGRVVGRTEATIGTTKGGEAFTIKVEDVDGTVLLTDTPGLSEIGEAGSVREAEARDLAARADLLLFVVDHDLIRSEYEPMVALARQGKRSIVVLNKKDRLIDEDRDAILAKLRERLSGLVAPLDVVAVSASPRPMPVRIQGDDGAISTVLEAEPPDVEPLRERIAAVLDGEGDTLRAGNLLLRAHLINEEARGQLSKERDQRAQAVIDKFQWLTAGTVFANPVPALDLMAAGAVQYQMITELAAVYGVELTTAHVKMIGSQMIQMLLKTGLVEASTSLIAGLFKSSLVGYAAGGAVQAVSMAYLAHVSGHAFADYFRHGQSWGDGGMGAALIRQFNLNSRADFLQEFAKQALSRVSKQVLKKAEAPAGGGPKS